MELQTVMEELKALGTEHTRKSYLSRGVREPLFGVATGAMKPLAKKIKTDQGLAMALYATGNYDACYLAGMIADPQVMTAAEFETWMETAYCHMLSDYVVAVTLAETDFAQEVADRWIDSDQALYRSAGWSCYCWLLGNRPDNYFEQDKLAGMLARVVREIHEQPDRARYAMNEFVIAVGVSYLPLHAEAVKAAEQIGKVAAAPDGGCKIPVALEGIRKAADKGRLGFKRRNVRC